MSTDGLHSFVGPLTNCMPAGAAAASQELDTDLSGGGLLTQFPALCRCTCRTTALAWQVLKRLSRPYLPDPLMSGGCKAQHHQAPPHRMLEAVQAQQTVAPAWEQPGSGPCG